MSFHIPPPPPTTMTSLPADVPTVTVAHNGASVVVALQGAHVVGWTTASGATPLYLSPKAAFQRGKAIRGGVPICWPQFSDMGTLPAHGVARTSSDWTVSENAKGVLTLAMPYLDTGVLRFTVRLDAEHVEFELSFNASASASAFEFHAALHTYFAVPDVKQVLVQGALDECAYADNLLRREMQPAAPIRVVDREIDRIYKATHGRSVSLTCAGMAPLTIRGPGFEDTVLWNPWVERTKKIGDLPEDAYQHFVCVESGSIFSKVRVEPGATWRASQIITVNEGPGPSHI